MIELLKQTKLFVLDLDGTFYLSDEIFDFSLDFLKTVEENHQKYLFFTNNSSKSWRVYIEKLNAMGCHIGRDQILTSGDVTIEYLNTYYKGRTVYLVGTEALRESFLEENIPLTNDMPDIVVVGFDTTLTYEKLERACTYIRNGAIFLATHLDINCPTKEGFIPDCGAFCEAIKLSTGKEPRFLGKPFEQTVEMIARRTGFAASEMAFIGDRIYTDVATGVKNGALGILVLTGETKLEDIELSDIKPDGVFPSLREIAAILSE